VIFIVRFFLSLYCVSIWFKQQKVIEILLEHGADINLRTNNDETVLELCDDPDIRDYIIQKSKEIESQQQQASIFDFCFLLSLIFT